MKLGDKVFIVRRLSNQKEECILDFVHEQKSKGSKKMVRVYWIKAKNITYDLVLEDNLVKCPGGSTKENKEVKKWFFIYEPHRQALLDTFFNTALREIRKKFNYSEFAENKIKELENVK